MKKPTECSLGLKLPERQEAVYKFLRVYVNRHGYGPSIGEIKAALKMKSSSTVAYHLERLTEKGWIKRMGPRAFRFLATEATV